MKLIGAAAIACVLTIAAAEAKPAAVTDPTAATKALYAKLEKDDYSTKLPLSARLDALMALDSKEANGEVGRLDGDYFTNSQDAKVSNVTVTSHDVENTKERKVVVVKFKNIDKMMENHLYWEHTKSGWVLDDVRYLDEKEGYTLSLLLKYGWDGPEEAKTH